jgi:hypothetical protein
MNIEKYTDRAKGFLQAAQTIALREGHQQFTPEHLLKALLDDNEGMAAGLIDARRRQSRSSPCSSPMHGLAKLPKVSGGGCLGPQPDAGPGPRLRHRREGGREGRRFFVTVERLLLALAIEKDTEAGKALAKAGVTAQGLNAAIEAIRKGRTADSASAEQSYDALKKYARDLTAAAREGKLDPVIGRDEEIRRTIQVLSRRTKNNPVLIGEPGVGKTAIAEGLGAAHRQWRRAREPEGQGAARARHGLADRGREISRRVRGAAEGRAQRGVGRRWRRHPVHRRDAHARRRRQGGWRDGCVEPAEAGAWRAANCTASARPRSTSTQICREGRGAWRGASSRSSSTSPRSRTRSRSCAA